MLKVCKTPGPTGDHENRCDAAILCITVDSMPILSNTTANYNTLIEHSQIKLLRILAAHAVEL